MKKDFLKRKKTALVSVIILIGVFVLAGCGGGASQISVITRENGSGTRDAFIELTGVLVSDDAGNKTDTTTKEATTIDGTQGVMSNVAGNNQAIGYISLGSLNSTVKALKIEGVDATGDNVKNGTYKLSRPFIIATKAGVSDIASDFIKFIMNAEGQKVIEDNGYVSVVDNAQAYATSGLEGKIEIAGSSSVSPVMEKLKEAYIKINTNVTIEIQTTDSTAGVTALKDGTCDIGMVSRELKDSEVGEGDSTLTPTTIAMDGIAVIVNNENECSELTIEQIKGIFTGEETSWENLTTK